MQGVRLTGRVNNGDYKTLVWKLKNKGGIRDCVVGEGGSYVAQ
jgi:hypothetical protein